jgi:hypothetical protein
MKIWNDFERFERVSCEYWEIWNYDGNGCDRRIVEGRRRRWRKRWENDEW